MDSIITLRSNTARSQEVHPLARVSRALPPFLLHGASPLLLITSAFFYLDPPNALPNDFSSRRVFESLGSEAAA